MEQRHVFTEFSTNFIKLEVLSANNCISNLKKINFSSTENHLPKNLLSVGFITCKIVKDSRKDDEIMYKFLNEAITAYSNCAAYMVKKLPLNNDFLKTVAAIHPMAILAKSTVILKAILNLLEIVTNVLSSTNQNEK